MSLIPLNVVIEDDLSLELVKQVLIKTNSSFIIDKVWPDTTRNKASRGNGYIFKKIKGFNNAANHSHFLVLTDLDTRECAPSFRAELVPQGCNKNMILRIAVREVEAWVLADRPGFADFLGIALKSLPDNMDDIKDPKELLFKIVKKSKKRDLKNGILPHSSTAKYGPDYNGQLISFLQKHWNLKNAVKYSDSLNRFVKALRDCRGAKV